MVLTDLFLLQENQGFLLQENGGKLIIGQVDIEDDGGPSGGKSRAVGYSAVKKQLGLKPTESFVGFVKGKVLSIIDQVIPKGLVTSKITTKESGIIQSKIITKESLNCTSKLLLPKEICHTECIVRKHPSIELANVVEEFQSILTKQRYDNIDTLQRQERNITEIKMEQDRIRKESLENIEHEKLESKRNTKIEKLRELQKILAEDIRKTPSINVDLNETIHQRGDLMRITANMNMQTGNIYMRIISDKGIIVQKAGLVKKSATGFQILIGTRDLKQGKYFIQVSNHRSFSPLGVAEFQVKGDSPILPFVPVIPFLLTPDSPTQKFEKVRFHTMQDSRVDAICAVHENKVFNLKSKNVPIPPLHFNCRCWLEGESS